MACESFPTPHLTISHKLHAFIERILCGMWVLVQAGNDAVETKTTENVNRGRNHHICTDIYRSLTIDQTYLYKNW